MWCAQSQNWCNSCAPLHCKYSSLLLQNRRHNHYYGGYNSSKYNVSVGCRIWCSSSDSNSSSTPKQNRGFGPRPISAPSNKGKKSAAAGSDDRKQQNFRKSSSQQSSSVFNQAPGLASPTKENKKSIVFDPKFEERLQAVRRSAIEQKKVEEKKEFGAIDYDAPVEPKSGTVGLGTKIGVGVAVVVFGLVFALGDFLPSGSVGPSQEQATIMKSMSEEDRANLQKRLEQFEATLNISPEDPTALEGAAVTLAQLGEYKRAALLLEDLSKKKTSDPDVFRLLGEVKYELKDYDGSAVAYRNSEKVLKTLDFEVLRGLTNSLLAAKKPDEAVQVLLTSRERLNKEMSFGSSQGTLNKALEAKPDVDPIQVDLLLGKAYSDWGHVSDAVTVYDQLISSHPNDFRGYLAKGILLKENGNIGDAERMFIQARFFAPEKVKALVDKYAR